MNKTELVAAVAEKAGMTKKDAERVVNATIDTIIQNLSKVRRSRSPASAILKSRTVRPG